MISFFLFHSLYSGGIEKRLLFLSDNNDDDDDKDGDNDNDNNRKDYQAKTNKTNTGKMKTQ